MNLKEQMVLGNLKRLQAYAKAQRLEVRTELGVEFASAELYRTGDLAIGFETPLIRRESRDSVETAAFYLVNTLELLGVQVPASAEDGR